MKTARQRFVDLEDLTYPLTSRLLDSLSGEQTISVCMMTINIMRILSITYAAHTGPEESLKKAATMTERCARRLTIVQ